MKNIEREREIATKEEPPPKAWHCYWKQRMAKKSEGGVRKYKKQIKLKPPTFWKHPQSSGYVCCK